MMMMMMMIIQAMPDGTLNTFLVGQLMRTGLEIRLRSTAELVTLFAFVFILIPIIATFPLDSLSRHGLISAY